MKELSDKADVASYQGSLYGAYLRGPWYAEGMLAYGYNRYDTSREISFGEIMRTANADYSGHAFSAYTEVEYRFMLNTLQVIPMASFQASSLTREGFTEEDAGALDLDADREHTSSLLGSLGVRLRKAFRMDKGSISPEVRARWLHEFSTDRYVLNAAFVGSALSTFTVKEDRPNRDSIVLGLGLSYETTKNLDLFLAYDANISGDRTEHGGSLGLQYRW
jgi:outer membrane autotransporter protein